MIWPGMGRVRGCWLLEMGGRGLGVRFSSMEGAGTTRPRR